MRRNQVKGARKMRRRPPRPHRADRKHLMDLGPKIAQASSARRYDLWPGLWNDQMGGHPWARVELRIARDRKWMLREARLLGFRLSSAERTHGCVLARSNKFGGLSPVIRGVRGRIATLLLNEADLLNKPSELIAHECVHAAMRFMDVRGVNVHEDSDREECLAYTVGELVRQANRIFYAHAFRQGAR